MDLWPVVIPNITDQKNSDLYITILLDDGMESINCEKKIESSINCEKKIESLR